MHENMIIMLESAMHDHVISSQQNQTQNFWQNHKNPKISPKNEKSRSKCMKEDERKRFSTHTSELKFGIGRILQVKKDFGERKGFGLREKRDRSRYLSLNKTGLTLNYI